MFAVVGEAVVDLVQQPGGDYRAHPGGSPLNVAVALARLGRPTRLHARLSGDTFGGMFRAHLAAAGVDAGGLVAAAEPSTLAVASIAPDGAATYDFWTAGTADWAWRPAELDSLAPGTTALHTGSMALEVPPGAGVILDLLRREHARGAVTISYDPNVRLARRGPRAAAIAAVEAVVRLAHLVKTSDEDLAWLYPGADPAEIAARWAALGPALAVVTLGPDGCLASTGGPAIRRPTRPVTVADTVGAGDAFTAGLLDALAPHLGARRLAGLTEADLVAALDRATLVAAVTCTRPGADPPTQAELTAFT